MVWVAVIALAAGLGTMRAAIDRGDVDEAARQGMLAGPSVIAKALVARDRPARLAGIAAAPISADREELLGPLAKLAADPDRRTAIPAAIAARQIARELAKRVDPPDDLAGDDIAGPRSAWMALARDRDRWIELRVIALDVVAALGGIGLDLEPALADRDPAFRRAAIAVVPTPVPSSMRGLLATIVIKDTDAGVALTTAAALCGDLAVLAAGEAMKVLDALGAAGIERIRSLVAREANREAKRCLR